MPPLLAHYDPNWIILGLAAGVALGFAIATALTARRR